MHQSGFLRRPLAIAASICVASLVPHAAALAVDAGQLTRQTQQQQEAVKKPAESAITLKPLQAAQSGSQVKFKVSAFRLEGLPDAEITALQPLYDRMAGRDVALSDIEAVNAQVMEQLSQQGLLAFVFLPPQDVKDGVVKVRILVATFEGVELSGETRLSQERVRAYFKDLKPGQRIDTQQYQRLLQVLNEVPGVNVQGGFLPGQQVGGSKLQVQLEKAPLLLTDLSVDNQGNFSTGTTRASAVLQLQGPLRLGDAWSATYSHSQGSDYLRTAASLPVGVRGVRAGLFASHMRYEIITPELVILQAKGTSGSAGADLTWPILRRDDAQVTLQAQYESKRFANQANGVVTTQYRSQTMQATVQAQKADNWLGGGVTSASVSLVRGLTDLDGSPNQEIDALTANTQGYFSLVRFNLSRQQQLGRQWILNLQFSSQFANRNLDSSERFYISGATAVRAYAGEGGGAEGQVYSAELSRPLGERARFGVFLDAGRVRSFVQDQFWGAPALNAYWLKGQGVNLSWRPRQNITVSATWSRRIGVNPAAGPGGADSDGTVRKHRVWLQASVAL